MSPYSENYCDFQRFLLFRNKARNAGRSRKNAGNKPKCRISRTIPGGLTPRVSTSEVERHMKCIRAIGLRGNDRRLHQPMLLLE